MTLAAGSAPTPPPLIVERSPAPPQGFDASSRLYLRPLGLFWRAIGDAAVTANSLPLAGGAIAFDAVELWLRRDRQASVSHCRIPDLLAWRDRLDGEARGLVDAQLHRLGAARAPIAGLDWSKPAIMGVVNVTPDSFSDGGDFADAQAAIAHGRALARAGAAVIDVGGESTRPGAAPVGADAECRRILPVIAALARAGLAVSVDTRNAATMAAAAAAGAAMINDVSALSHDPDSAKTAAGTGLPVVLMHTLDDPRRMQVNPAYAHAPLDIYDFLERRIAAATAAGIGRFRVIVDPGIGFGKTVAHNLALLRWLGLFHGLGCPLLIGVSRKSFIGHITGVAEPKGRLAGSLAAALAALDHGVQILRVHDVAETAQAIAVWRAIRSDGEVR